MNNVWNSDAITNNIVSQKEIKPHMRAILIDWLFEVANCYEFPNSYVHRAVKILDIVISKYQLKTNDMQLLGCAILSIIDHYFSRFSIDYKKWMKISDNCFNADQLFTMQYTVLNILDWNVFHKTYYDVIREADIKSRQLYVILADYLLYFPTSSSYDINQVAHLIIKIIDGGLLDEDSLDENNRQEHSSLDENTIINDILYLFIRLCPLTDDKNHLISKYAKHFIKTNKMTLESEDFIKILTRLNQTKSISASDSPTISDNRLRNSVSSSDTPVVLPDLTDMISIEHTEFLKVKFLNKLGEGTYGQIYSANYADQNYALKKFINCDGKIEDSTIREIVALKKIKSPNVIGCFKVIVDRDNTLCMLTQRCNMDLYRWITKYYEFSKVKSIIQDIINGLFDIHAQGFIHRDLKPQNILLYYDKQSLDETSSHCQAKICDFGISTHVDIYHDKKEEPYDMYTLWYRSPELLLGAAPNSKTSDIWALGCVIYELIMGKPLMTGDSNFDQLFGIFKIFGTTPDIHMKHLPNYKSTLPKYKVTEKIKDEIGDKLNANQLRILMRMFDYDLSQRITIEDIKLNWMV